MVIIQLGACLRIDELLSEAHFGQIFRPFLLNRTTIVKHILVLNPCGAYAKEHSLCSFRLKCSKNLIQNGTLLAAIPILGQAPRPFYGATNKACRTGLRAY